MTEAGRVMQSDYMRFAKLETAAKYNLATSGVADCSLADLGVAMADLELHGPNAYGYPPLIEAIAARFSASSESCVVTAGGCSFANHFGPGEPGVTRRRGADRGSDL